MVREEDYTKAKNRIIELEKELQEHTKLIKQYIQQEKRVAFDKSKIEIESRLNVFKHKFYYLTYKAVHSISGSPQEFMTENNYHEHRLKALLRFKISSGEEFLQFVSDCGITLLIGNETQNCYYPCGMSKIQSENMRMFKRDLNTLFWGIYSKSPQYTYEDLTGFETRRLKWLFSFELKSERDLATLLHTFGLTMTVRFKTEDVVF